MLAKYTLRLFSNLRTFQPYQFFYPAFSTLKNKKIVEKFELDRSIESEKEKEIIFPKKRYIYKEKEGKLIEIDESLPKADPTTDLDKSPKRPESLEKAPEPPKEEPTERLSKRLSRLGVCSRRQAEKLIATGVVKVNGRTVLSNVPVTENDKISIFTKHGEKLPVKEDTKIWIFFKPKNLICSHSDPQGRPTIFDYLRAHGFDESKHIISVVRVCVYISNALGKIGL